MSQPSARRVAAAALVLALGSAGALLAAAPAYAVNYGASNAADLAAAVTAANGNPGFDTIYIEADITLTGNLPSITEDITITSQGGPWTIDAAGFNGFDFDGVDGGEITVGVSRLTIENAEIAISSTFTDINLNEVTLTTSNTGMNHSKGGLFIADSFFSANTGTGLFATLNVTDAGEFITTSFDDNGSTGAVVNVNGASNLELDRVTADGNTNLGLIINAPADANVEAVEVSTSSNGGSGLQLTAGGTSNLYFIDLLSSSNGNRGIDLAKTGTATVTVTSAVLNDNTDTGLEVTADDGGSAQFAEITLDGNGTGVDATATGTSQFILYLSTVTNVTSGSRGIYLQSSDDAVAVIANTTVSGNTGGGLQVTNGPSTGGLTIVAVSTFDDNGTIGSPGGGAYISNVEDMDVLVTASTFSNNVGNLGGGLYVGAGAGSTANLIQVTASGNNANSGGGLYLESTGVTPGSILLENSTVTNNSSEISVPGARLDSEDAEITNSIFSGNDGIDLTVVGLAQVNYNLIEVPAANTTVEANKGTGNILGASANLGALQNNGGTTLTHLPAAGSPAINAGDPAFPADPAFDQRGEGFARIIAGRVDIGAVETAAVIVPAPTALAATGTDPQAALAAGAVLAAAGLLALLFTRRRRAQA